MTMRPTTSPPRIDAGTLEQPLDTLVWSDGSTLAGVQPFSLRMLQMHEALQEPGATAAAHAALLRLCLPDGATWTKADGTKGTVDEAFRIDLSGPRVFLVFEHAQYRLQQMVAAVEEARKNGAGAEAVPGTAPSAPTTNTSTRSRGSRARSQAVVPGSRTRTGRSTSSSTSSIGSKKPSGSKDSTLVAETSAPSGIS